MEYKTILVHVGPPQSSHARVHAAVHLAQSLDATLIGLGAEGFDPFIEPATPHMDPATLHQLCGEIKGRLDGAKTWFEAATAALGQNAIWRATIARPAEALVAQARCADLIVTSRPAKGEGGHISANLGTLIMESGLPVLVTAFAGERLEGKSVVIGWKNTRETRRAVWDALPFLTRAERVSLVRISKDGEVGSDEAEMRDVAERLSRHGAHASFQTAPHRETTVANDLLAAAEACSADLIVVGGYGHSRLREWALGGVTHDLMTQSSKYVLFSH